MRILYAVSSIGLGHAARSRLLGKLLQDMGAELLYYAPGRAGDYLARWGMPVSRGSRLSSDLSSIAEDWYRRTGEALIGLRAALQEHRIALENARWLLRDVEEFKPDLVVCDESWEAISVAERIGVAKAWIADFPLYPPIGGPSRIAAAVAVNRFLLRRLPLFDERVYVGLEWEHGDLRAFRVLGPRLREVLEEFHVIGPVPAVSSSEALDREAALSSLGLDPGEHYILVQSGGTLMGLEYLAEAARALEGLGYRVVVASGMDPGAGRWIGLNPKLPLYLRGFDCVVSNAGLTTASTLAHLGVRGLLKPLPGHFEQEHVAVAASRRWECLRPLRDSSGLEWCLGGGVCGGDPGLFDNALRAARLLYSLV
ncbi:MAG: hypothetical protein F7C38_05165 [Desulfurococcales archaeon]|nr:hypothetical protein [Desulfurococcales archaeon]